MRGEKKAKKGSADSDEDKKKKGKKSKNKQVDYAAIYQNELLEYHTDSSDGYEDEYYKKKGKLSNRRYRFPIVPFTFEQDHLRESLCDCSWVKALLCST